MSLPPPPSRRPVPLFLAAAFGTLLVPRAACASEAPARPTRFLTEPAVSADRIAFAYANDVWTARRDGTGVVRITSGPGAKGGPAFSPDGSLLAFSGDLDGNVDVYVVPAAGGVPRRLTHHPGPDLVQGFTPDGKAVLFTSPREAFNNRHTQLFTVPVSGGVPEKLPIPNAASASFSPDGKKIAYNPVAARFLQWKGYRGGTASRIWLYDVATHAVEEVPRPEGRCNDADPFFLAGKVFFRSDRDGELNVYSFDPATKAVTALTRHADFPVLHASGGAGTIVYEQAGTLHLLDPASGKATDVPLTVAADLPETRARWAKGAKWVRDAALSPSGARVLLDFRGEIVSVPAEKGDPRNLTETPGVHERFPSWSPDGKKVAWFSDASGEYQLVVAPADGKGPTRSYPLGGAGFYDRPAFSPDGTKLAFTDNSWSLFVIDLATGAVRRIAQEPLYGPANTKGIRGVFSPDSRWIAYTVSTAAYVQTLHLYSIEKDRSYRITDGLSDVSDPAFDAGGKYLYFLSSTDAGPVRNWFSLENQDMRVTRTIWLAVLAKGVPSPLAKESDEEKGPGAEVAEGRSSDAKEAEEGKTGKDAKGEAGDKSNKPAPKKPVVVAFDPDGIETRIVDLPVKPAEISGLAAGEAGKVFYLRKSDGKSALVRFDLKERKAETLVPDADDFELSADGRKLLYRLKESLAVVSTAKKAEPSDGKLKLDAIAVRVEPRAEWAEMFLDAWRINRDYFYDPGMHGVDWKARREKYAAFLPDLSCRADLNLLIQWLCSDLGVGHHRVSGGDSAAEPPKVPGGLLGADLEVANGRYRLRKVFGGLNWNPELRAPLSEPGVDAKAGEYLLAVNGVDLKPPESLFARLEGTAGKIVTVTLGPSPDGKGSRTVNVVPLESELALRNRDWVEGNIRKVDAATGGRVAYVYVPNTSTLGHEYFKRYFFPQAYKDAVIVDERFNAGGSVADYYIDILKKPRIAYWAMRYGADMKTPSASIQGPKAMIIDETAGSGGDLLPWMFRKFQVGPLIGKRTWGGLVGILGFPVLMDGGSVTAPNLAFWTPEEGFAVENVGVPPDVDVEQTPAEVIAGHDPQLEKAIEVVLDALKRNPPEKPVRPPYPKRGR